MSDEEQQTAKEDKHKQGFMQRYVMTPQMVLAVVVALIILTPLGIVSVYTAKVVVGLIVAIFLLTL